MSTSEAYLKAATDGNAGTFEGLAWEPADLTGTRWSFWLSLRHKCNEKLSQIELGGTLHRDGSTLRFPLQQLSRGESEVFMPCEGRASQICMDELSMSIYLYCISYIEYSVLYKSSRRNRVRRLSLTSATAKLPRAVLYRDHALIDAVSGQVQHSVNLCPRTPQSRSLPAMQAPDRPTGEKF